jgi:spectinomycin phosphotransferase
MSASTILSSETRIAMLEKPDLPDARIAACLQAAYTLSARQITFLPLGADQHTAVYRVVAGDHAAYFLKLRGDPFDETSVALPRFLSDRGVQQIIAPLRTHTGRLWANLEPFNVILYPFVEGRNGYEVALSERQWREFGVALRRIHSVALPPALARRIRPETYAPRWRETVRTFLERLENGPFVDPIAAQLAAFLKAKRDEVEDLVSRAERLAASLWAQSPDFVLCHSDLHAGNILIDGSDALYIVDWDDPILAPKERDLMYAGGAQGFRGHSPEEEEALFYRGYGETEIDRRALAYYRYERIIEDIGIYCQQLLLTDAGGQDREQSLKYLKSNFVPDGTIAIAYRSDGTAHPG